MVHYDTATLMLLQTVFALDGVECSVKTLVLIKILLRVAFATRTYTCSVIIFLVIRSRT